MKVLPLLVLASALTLSLQAADAPAKKSAPKNSGPKWKKLIPQTPAGFTLKTLLVESHPEHNVELYVYVPDAEGVWPCILDIHGGGWQARQIEADKPMMERLAQRGYVTALVSYRLSQEAKFPAALHDCKAAIRCLKANAKTLKLDPERIGIIGGSAGGHLSGLTSMTTGLKEFDGHGAFADQSTNIKAAIVMAATQDLMASNLGKTNANAIAFFGGALEQVPEVYKAASPITHVRACVPPTIFIEGEKDTLKIGRAEMLEKLSALGIETAIHTLKDAPYPFWMSDPWCAQVVDIADSFFKKHLPK
ncbi:MAG: alpha/beta hydrolase fold domain-containing protein [Verrucomicrobiaceae bacterium]